MFCILLFCICCMLLFSGDDLIALLFDLLLALSTDTFLDVTFLLLWVIVVVLPRLLTLLILPTFLILLDTLLTICDVVTTAAVVLFLLVVFFTFVGIFPFAFVVLFVDCFSLIVLLLLIFKWSWKLFDIPEDDATDGTLFFSTCCWFSFHFSCNLWYLY